MEIDRTVQLDLSAAILTGGQSRRMGADKALLTLGGRTLLERSIEAVSQVSSDVMIVGDRAAYWQFGVPVVADRYPDGGPLGGIATALAYARHAAVLVVACDMPFLAPALLRAMAAERRDYDVLVPVRSGADGTEREAPTLEPLHAIYHSHCLGVLQRRIADGRLKIRDAFEELSVRTLPESWMRRFDPDLLSLTNANRPVEWDAIRQRIEGVESTEEVSE